MLQATEGDEYFVRVVDFGLAKFTAHGDVTSVLAGTPAYMAPEQLRGANLGRWTDIYALGAVAYFIITGRRLYSGASRDSIAALKLDPNHDPTLLLDDIEIPRAVVSCIRRALAYDHEKRYQTATEFREALEQAYDSSRAEWSGRSIPSPATPPPIPAETSADPATTEADPITFAEPSDEMLGERKTAAIARMSTVGISAAGLVTSDLGASPGDGT